ncbi:MAG TPA: pitrilysin family protein [Polyangia bacterium]|jgi:zinc protease|nr:pitrilysin family protein [Polyangia bacterium]
MVTPTQMQAPPAVGPLPPLRTPVLETFALSNGLQVVVIPRHAAPIVSLTLMFRAGSDAEAPGLTGLASLTAEMLDEGAGDRSALDLAADLEQLGADLWLGAGRDGSQLNLQVPRKGFEPTLAIAADVLLRPRLGAADWERVQHDRLTALGQRRDQPEAVANIVADRVLYSDNHPYGQSSEGRESTVQRITLDDIARFHAAHWRCNQASLIVAGDVDPVALPAQLERAFGAWTGGPIPALALAGGARQPPRLVLVDRPDAPQSVIRLVAPGQPRLSPDRTALRMVNAILGGSFTSRLNFNLREQKGYTYGASSGFNFMRHAGAFSARASVFTDVTAASVTEFLNELRGIGERPITADELIKARATLLGRAAEALSTTGGLAATFGEISLYDLPLDEPGRFVAQMDQQDAASLQALAARHIDADRMGIVIVGNRSAIEPGLRALGLPAPELRDADGDPL